MRLLVVTPRLPYPPDRGDRLLAYHTIAAFASRHEVVVASLVDGTEPPGAVSALEQLGVAVHVVHLPRWQSWAQALFYGALGDPLQIGYYRSGALFALVRRLSERRFDAAFAHGARVGPYAVAANARCHIGLLTDAMGLSLRRRAARQRGLARAVVRLEADRMERFEFAQAARLDRGWLVAEVDRMAFPEALRPRLRVVRNGFPPAFLAYDRARVRPRRLVFVGHMSVPHNVDAARVLVGEILPRVRHTFPDATLRLVGASPSPAVARLAEAGVVEVTGFVDDLGAEYAAADVFVAPIRFSAGTQNKLIEAMAAGVPCVVSSAVAAGVAATAGRDLEVAEEPADYAARIVALLGQPAEAQRVGERGRAHVRALFSWDNALNALDEAMRDAPAT